MMMWVMLSASSVMIKKIVDPALDSHNMIAMRQLASCESSPFIKPLNQYHVNIHLCVEPERALIGGRMVQAAQPILVRLKACQHTPGETPAKELDSV